MSWGTKIALFYSCFVVILVSLVVSSFSNKHQLVTEDYYGKELVYEAHQAAVRNAAKLTAGIEIQYQAETQEIQIHYPEALTEITGNIVLYRPDNSALDHQIEIIPDVSRKQIIHTTTLLPGTWRIQIDWESGGIPYYTEEKVYVEMGDREKENARVRDENH